MTGSWPRALAAACAAAALALAAAAPAAAQSPWNPGWCTATEDPAGHLAVAGGGLLGAYAYGWEIYAPQPGGYSPPVGSGQFTTAPDGTFALTSPGTVAAYLAAGGAGTVLEFYAEHGTIHAHGYDQEIVIAACPYPAP